MSHFIGKWSWQTPNLSENWTKMNLPFLCDLGSDNTVQWCSMKEPQQIQQATRTLLKISCTRMFCYLLILVFPGPSISNHEDNSFSSQSEWNSSLQILLNFAVKRATHFHESRGRLPLQNAPTSKRWTNNKHVLSKNPALSTLKARTREWQAPHRICVINCGHLSLFNAGRPLAASLALETK